MRIMMLRRSVSCAFLLAIVGCLFPHQGHARPKTVFRSLALEVHSEFVGENAGDSLTFMPAWTFAEFRAPLAGDPIPFNGGLVASARDGEIVALEAALGQAYWRKLLASPLSVGPLAFDGVVFQAADDGRLYALDGADGDLLWSTLMEAKAAVRPERNGTRLIVATTTEALLSFDAVDGTLQARVPLPGLPTSPPVVGENRIVIGTDHGMVVVLDADSLQVRWRRYLRHPITSPPLIHEGRLYIVGADRQLRCLRLKNGKERWAQSLGSIVTAGMFTHGRYLYVLCYDNDIYVMRHKNGHVVARLRLDHRLDRSAGIFEDHLLVIPFTESAVEELSLPALRPGGRFSLDHPGEWFTTSPVVFTGRVAVGYGRSEGRIIALDLSVAQEDAGGLVEERPESQP